MSDAHGAKPRAAGDRITTAGAIPSQVRRRADLAALIIKRSYGDPGAAAQRKGEQHPCGGRG